MSLNLAFQIAIICTQLALIGAIIAFTVKSATIGLSFGFDVPFVHTPQRYFPIIASALTIQPGDVVYDLGCGDGYFLLWCAKQYPEVRFVGIERNIFLYTKALLRRFVAGNPSNISFRREDFFTTNIDDATKIYAYLLPSVMNKLFGQRSHIRLASRAFKLNGREIAETIELSKIPGWHEQHLLHVYEL